MPWLKNTKYSFFMLSQGVGSQIRNTDFIIQIQNTVFIFLSQGVGSLPDGEEQAGGRGG